jgi:hypothetical protein
MFAVHVQRDALRGHHMSFHLRRLTWGAFALLMLLAPSHAQTPRTMQVSPGQEVTVVQAPTAALKVDKPPSLGTHRLATEGANTTLFYKAPEARATNTDELTYSIGNAATVVTLQISPPAPGFTAQAYDAAAKAIFLLFVLAVVLESALALLFNWRPFVETFNSRAVRPLVAFIVATIFVFKYDLDLITGLVNASTGLTYGVSKAGLILTAMVIAGGSAGVNNLLVSLGFRQVRTPETVVARPEKNQAWISVRLKRVKAVGEVTVCVDPPGAVVAALTDDVPDAPAPSSTASIPKVVGTIRGTTRPRLNYFFSDPGRFPGYGGWEVKPNEQIVIKVYGKDKNGEKIGPASWGPYTLADRAIVDIELTL